MTPTDLRALAARVLADEPSDELRDAVLIALGWYVPMNISQYWLRPDGSPCHDSQPPNPLTSHDAAFAAMPAGYPVIIEQHPSAWLVTVMRQHGPTYQQSVCSVEATTFPRALTAAGLLARAVDAEQGDGA